MSNRDYLYGGMIIALVALLVLSVLTQGFGLVKAVDGTSNNSSNTNTTTTTVASNWSGTKPVVQLFTMSYCPYGNIAEEAIEPAVKLLEGTITFEPHYVIYNNYGGAQYCIENGAYCSMHGAQEMTQDIRELCVWKYDKSKFWDFVFAMNTQCTYSNADTCWESVASGLGIDTSKVKTCQADEASSLAAADDALNQQYGVQGSPTLIIDGKEVQVTSRSPEGFKQAICNAFGSSKPTECNTVLSGSAGTASGGCG